MLWLFNENLLNNNFKFYQIFNNSPVFNESDNIIYKLDDNINTDLSKINPTKFNFQIKIMSNIINYLNLDNNMIFTFTKNENFINNSSNAAIEFNYKLINNNKLPSLSTHSYDFYYDHVEFNIFKINDNLLFVKQINKSNNSYSNYWISNTLSLKL